MMIQHSDNSEADGPQRVFSYTQMYFFILSYMSSWEAIATCVTAVPTRLPPQLSKHKTATSVSPSTMAAPAL